MANQSWGANPIPERVSERAYRSASFDGECWISTYSVGSHGYAQIGWQADGRLFATTAHRAAWVYVNGPIPAGMTVDHLCHVRRCVTVDHLRLLTNSENARRNRPDYDEDYCRRGHLRSENTVMQVKSNGKRARVCRICVDESNKRSQERRDAIRSAKP